MQINKVVDNSKLLRIEHESGASITVKKLGKTGQILAIMVPEDDRRERIGSALLNGAEVLLSEQGIDTFVSDFSDHIESCTAFFESKGYNVTKSAPIISLGMKKLLTNVNLRRIMLNDLEDVTFSSLYDLPVEKLDELLDTLAGMKIDIGNSDIARFSQNASGVTYDINGKLKAFIFCSTNDAGIHVDFLSSTPDAGPNFVIGAIQGMMKYIINDGGARNYEKLTLIACNSKINDLLQHFAKKGIESENIGAVVTVTKTGLERELCVGNEVYDDLDDDAVDTWQREIRKAPMQRNISWKMPWTRGIDVTAKSSEPEVTSPQSPDKEIASMPDKLRKRSGVKINFDKYEDEIYGLKMSGTRRITVDNLSAFQSVLSPEMVTNLPRPFYRGLAVGDTGAGSTLVWEYKNLEEEDEETAAELMWIDSGAEDELNILLNEFTSEIGKEKTVSSFFEFPELSSDNRSVLENSGFKIDEGESRDLVVTIEDLTKIATLSKAPIAPVQSLEEIDEKHYKRGVTNSMFCKRKGLMEDIILLPKAWFDEKISSCVMEDSKVNGMLLIHEGEDKLLYIDLLFSVGSEYRIDMVNMMRYSLAAAAKLYPLETGVVIRRHNNDTRALSDKLFPERKGETVLIGTRKEEVS